MKVSGQGFCSEEGYSIIPRETYFHEVEFFTNATHGKDTNKNGSGTPLDYTVTAPKNSLVYGIELTLVDDNITSILDYGSVAALANGCQLLSQEGDEDVYEYYNFQALVDFTHVSSTGGGSISLVGNNTENTMTASMNFIAPLKSAGTTELIFRVRDDLSTIKYQRINILYVEVTAE